MAVIINFDANGIPLKGLSRDQNFSITITDAPAVLPAVVDEANLTGDANWLFNQTEAILDNKDLVITPSTLGGAYLFELLDGSPDFEVNAAGEVLCVQEKYAIANSGGVATVEAASTVAGSKIVKPYLDIPSNYVLDFLFSSFEAGSLGQHLREAMGLMISGLTPDTLETQRYWQTNNANVDNPSATLNPTRFCAGVDLSAMSAMRESTTDDRYPCCLISDRHIIGAEHGPVAPLVGEKVVWQDSLGVFVEAFVSSVVIVHSDTYVALLDRSVTGLYLKPFKLMPEHWEYIYAPALHGIDNNANASITEMPLLCKRMHDRSGSFPVSWVSINGQASQTASRDIDLTGNLTVLPHEGVTELEPWSKEVIPGDSGSPSFYIIDGEPIYACANNGAGGSNDAISNMIPLINNAMNTLSGLPLGTYKVLHPSLASFTEFGE